MDDLIAFVRARLVEDAAAASAASEGPWEPWRTSRIHGTGQLRHVVALPGQKPGSHAAIATASWLDAEHIARHDPARALREVEAKRRLLQQFELRGNSVRRTVQPSTGGVWDDLLRLLALPYADNPDYRQEWTP